MVNLVLNLYTDNEINENIIKDNILIKNPVIFFIDDKTGSSMYKVLNLCRAYHKDILTLRYFDLDRTFAYLYSFPNLSSKQILFMAPMLRKSDATLYAKQLLSLLNKTVA